MSELPDLNQPLLRPWSPPPPPLSLEICSGAVLVFDHLPEVTSRVTLPHGGCWCQGPWRNWWLRSRGQTKQARWPDQRPLPQSQAGTQVPPPLCAFLKPQCCPFLQPPGRFSSSYSAMPPPPPQDLCTGYLLASSLGCLLFVFWISAKARLSEPQHYEHIEL